MRDTGLVERGSMLAWRQKATRAEVEREARYPAKREDIEGLIEAAYCGQLALSLAGCDEDAEKIGAALARVRGEA